jgi:hypothetical protein
VRFALHSSFKHDVSDQRPFVLAIGLLASITIGTAERRWALKKPLWRNYFALGGFDPVRLIQIQ